MRWTSFVTGAVAGGVLATVIVRANKSRMNWTNLAALGSRIAPKMQFKSAVEE